MPNSIYRGGGIDTPKTLTLSWPSSPSASANQLPFTPGTAVVIGGPASAIYADPVLAVTQANSANRGRIGLLAHADYEEMPSFLTEGSTNDVDPLYTLIGTDWRPWLVYLIEPGQEYQWAVVTGSLFSRAGIHYRTRWAVDRCPKRRHRGRNTR